MESYYFNKRYEVVQYLPQKGSGLRILDIGCAAGVFKTNTAENCEYWGIEPCLEAANIASLTLHKVLVGTFNDVHTKLPDNYFDCVIAFDVIEHMENENKFLQDIKAKIKADGVLVGSIPNVRYIGNLIRLLILKDWKYMKSGVLDETHLRFFTEKSLKRTLEENGYSVELFGGINPVEVNSKESFGLFCRTLVKVTLAYLLGRDSRFLQFAFRISPRKLSHSACD